MEKKVVKFKGTDGMWYTVCEKQVRIQKADGTWQLLKEGDKIMGNQGLFFEIVCKPWPYRDFKVNLRKLESSFTFSSYDEEGVKIQQLDLISTIYGGASGTLKVKEGGRIQISNAYAPGTTKITIYKGAMPGEEFYNSYLDYSVGLFAVDPNPSLFSIYVD